MGGLGWPGGGGKKENKILIPARFPIPTREIVQTPDGGGPDIRNLGS